MHKSKTVPHREINSPPQMQVCFSLSSIRHIRAHTHTQEGGQMHQRNHKSLDGGSCTSATEGGHASAQSGGQMHERNRRGADAPAQSRGADASAQPGGQMNQRNRGGQAHPSNRLGWMRRRNRGGGRCTVHCAITRASQGARRSAGAGCRCIRAIARVRCISAIAGDRCIRADA